MKYVQWGVSASIGVSPSWIDDNVLKDDYPIVDMVGKLGLVLLLTVSVELVFAYTP